MMRMPNPVPPGLIEKIEAAGCTIERVYVGSSSEFEWRSSNPETAQAIVASYSLAEAKDALKSRVAEIARLKLDEQAARSGYSMSEIATWADKERAARQFLGPDPLKRVPDALVLEASAAGLTVAELADRIVTNASLWRAESAAIMGARTRLRTSIDAIASLEEAARFDVRVGW